MSRENWEKVLNFLRKRGKIGVTMTEERARMYEEFVRLVESGTKRKDAYRTAFGRPELSDIQASKLASKALQQKEAREKILELRAAAEGKIREREGAIVYSKVQLMELLTGVIKDSLAEGEKKTAITAMQTLAKLAGYNEPQQVEIKDDSVVEFVRGQIERASGEGLIRRGKK